MEKSNEYCLPNFLLVGAAKSGTTTLYKFLREHPQIYLPEIKEPKFFSSIDSSMQFAGPGDAFVQNRTINRFSDYLALYEGVCGKMIRIGDASADTLYYNSLTIPKIKEIIGDPKIIIILRNPVDRAFSAYNHLKIDGRETLSFSEALEHEDYRVEHHYEFIWHYKRVGLYHDQVSSFLENFTNVKICLFDDLEVKMESLLARLYEFLGVESYTQVIPRKYNRSGVPYLGFLHRLIRNENTLKRISKFFVPKSLRRQLSDWNNRYNLRKIEMPEGDRRYLVNFFEQDIKKLEKIINRDLSPWLR